MEHGLHLAAHHFITALNKKMIQEDEANSDDEGEIIALEDGHTLDEPVDGVDGYFIPGDLIGKLLALVALVSVFVHNTDFIYPGICRFGSLLKLESSGQSSVGGRASPYCV